MLYSHGMPAITDRPDPVGTFISTFTGAGGLDIGLAWAGFEPIWANDIDPAAVETYNQVFEGHVAVMGDLRLQRIPEEGSADLVVGGPPCQGFSVAGKMDPNDPRSRHVWDFLGVVARVRPRVFIMENVKALAVNRRWAALRDSLRLKAESLGYTTQLLVLNASHFGVPQARERMFLIGRLEGKEILPVPVTAGSPPTVRHALAKLPPYGEPGNNTKCRAAITIAKKPVLRRSPYAGMLFNGQGRPLNLDRPAPTLPASMGGNRTPIIDQRELETGRPGWILTYHRHLWEGGEPWDEVPPFLRRITVEEAAALQSFPQGIPWGGGKNAAYRQIGNAVPPLLAMHVGLAVRDALGLPPAEIPGGIPDYTEEARKELLAQAQSVLPDGVQLSLELEQLLTDYVRAGDPGLLRRAVEKVERGLGVEVGVS